MTTPGKITDGLRAAVKSARCDHDLEPLLHWREGTTVTIRERCNKCLVTFSSFVELPIP